MNYHQSKNNMISILIKINLLISDVVVVTTYTKWNINACNTPIKLEGTLIEAARHGTGSVSRFIGRSRSEDSVCNSIPANNANKGSASRSNSAGSEEGVTASPTDSNPSMDKDVNTAPTTKTSSSSAKYKTKDHHTHLYGSRCSDSNLFSFFVFGFIFRYTKLI